MNQEVKIQNALDFKRILDGMDEAMLAKAHVSISAPARFAGSFVVYDVVLHGYENDGTGPYFITLTTNR